MTKILIEFGRPDGTILRNVDAGFDYIDNAQIPWSNAERRVRIQPTTELFAEPVPLPDALNSVVRVAASLAIGGSSVLKTQVKIDGVTQELVVRVSTELIQRVPDTAATLPESADPPDGIQPPPSIRGGCCDESA
jgi:hypothetical protein